MNSFKKGNKHIVNIDDKSVLLDSMNEEVAIKRIVAKYNFSHKWDRPIGIKHAGKYYTADFELAVDDFGNTSRALVEVKQYKKDISAGVLKRLVAVSNFYHTNHLYLYVVSSDSWYRIYSPKDVRVCKAPSPGRIPIAGLYKPKSIITRNSHGRRYRQSYSETIYSIIRLLLK